MPALSPTTSSCRVAASRCLGLATAALAVAALAAPVAGGAEAKYEGISADGKVAIFSTTDRLVSGDTDNRRDVYQRSIGVGDHVTRQVSLGPRGGNDAFDASYYGIDPLGTTVLFSTAERLTLDDTDNTTDIYMRDLNTNTTTRVSRGASSCEPGCGNLSDPASPVPGGVSSDGSTVFFATAESLGPEDGDASLDVYASDVASSSTALVSRGASDCELSGCGKGDRPAFFQGASESGQKAFFTTAEGLVAGEDDGQVDIYERDLDTGTTRLVSVAGTCPGDLPPGQNCDPTFGGASGDGSHVFFETNDRISLQDTDSSQDVYDWFDGVATRASTGPDGGNGAVNALYAGNSSPDGFTVFFATDERLDTGADTDSAQDVYARIGGAATELVSAGEDSCLPSCGNDDAFPAALRWVSPQPSSSVVVFSTAESLSDLDRDSSQDVYVRDLATGTTTLASQGDSSCAPDCGSDAFDANFARASGDGSRVFFVTDESLTEADIDTRTDIYERSGGVTTLISTGAINGNGPFNAQLHGVSEDGSRAFFVTQEKLAVDDSELTAENDVYMRLSGGTLLVSVGNDPNLVLGPPPPALLRTNPPSPNPSLEFAVVGQAAAGALIKIYTNSDCTGDVAATGTAEQLADPNGIPVPRVDPGTTTSFWATAEAEGVTSPCSTRALSYTQQSESTQPPPSGDPAPDSGAGGGGDSGDGDSGTGKGSTGGPPQFHSGGIAFVTPVAQITFGPAFKTRKRRVVFRFFDATGQPGTRFICKRDRRRWRSCGSPARLKRLRPGKHVFAVKAVNAAGAWQARPVKRKFKVVR